MTRILIAEDECDLRKRLSMLLLEEGFETIEASDGAEALRLIENEGQLDLILTDINMPYFSGFEVAEHARAKTPLIPILFMTGDLHLVTGHYIEAPFNCLSKPLKLKAVIDGIQHLLIDLPL